MSFPHLELAADAHDRVGARRYDDAWLAEAWADGRARALLIAGTRIRPVGGQIDWWPTGQAPEGVRILLGLRDGIPHWAVLVDAVLVDELHTPGDRADWVGLRAALLELMAGPPGQAPLVLHAIGLAEWHAATRHCPRCGAVVETRAAGHEKVCPACGKTQFPRTDPAVIMAVVRGAGTETESLLLGRQAAWPPGRFSTLAGFVEPGESLEDACRREVAEEVGVRVGRVDYFGNQAWPFPASLMVGLIGHAESETIRVDGQEIEAARWFTRQELRTEAEAGRILLPQGISISRSLVEHWYGGPLPGHW